MDPVGNLKGLCQVSKYKMQVLYIFIDPATKPRMYVCPRIPVHALAFCERDSKACTAVFCHREKVNTNPTDNGPVQHHNHVLFHV